MKKYNKYLLIAIFIAITLISICFVPFNASKLIPTIEEQIASELGVNAHIERLILRLGPQLKLKAPIMHLTYDDGKKFAQFDNIKFYISWASLLKEKPYISLLYANKLSVQVSSTDKYLKTLLNKLEVRDFKEVPNVKLREYSISYKNYDFNDTYSLNGKTLELLKLKKYKNVKLISTGVFGINSKKHITYDLAITPNFDKPEDNKIHDLTNIIEQIKELDFYSDIIADLKLYNNNENTIQASGLINIDNISVLDFERKNPKSFIYLTLWGDKASVLSNIYTSHNKKVYIDGMINNSKKPVLDLKVKTDEIELSDLYKKLKIVVNNTLLKEIENVTGTLNANFSLKGDLNKIKSNGYLNINNATIFADGVKINNINSDIDFSNNIINIKNTKGYVNDSEIIVRGKIDKNINIEILSNRVKLDSLLPKTFGIKRGICSIIANISGDFNKLMHKENIQIEDLILDYKGNILTLDSFKYNSEKSNLASATNVIIKNNYTDTIKLPTVNAYLDNDSIKIPNLNIYMPNSKLTTKGSIINYKNDINFNFITEGFINTKDLKILKNQSGRYPLNININGNKDSQTLLAQLLIEKTDIFDEPLTINLATKIEKDSIKIEDLSLITLNGKFSEDIKNNIKGSKKIIVTGGIENLKEPSLKNVRIFIPQQFNFNYLGTIAQIKGDIFINGKYLAPEIVGQIVLNNLFNQDLQISTTNCTLDFNKNNLIVNAPLFKLLDSSMSINSLISTDFTNGVNVKNINIKSKYLNTDTILLHKDNPAIKSIPVKITNGKFYSERVLANIYSSPLYLSGFLTDFEIVNNIINLKNISSELYNGKLTGSIKYDLKNEYFDTNIMARNVSASPIFNVISNKKEAISGTMDFDAKLNGELNSKNSLSGNIKFVVNNGRMSTLGKLEHLLYAQNVIADNMLRTSLSVVTKAITLKDTGLFKYLRGDITLEEGIANIKLLQSQGPLMSLFIKGKYNPLTDYAQLIVLGRLSDEIVSGLGAFGEFSFNKLLIMINGTEQSSINNVLPADFEKIPQLPMKNTKEFRSIINGIIDKPSSVILFNWISYTEKELRQKDVPLDDTKLPDFLDKIP